MRTPTLRRAIVGSKRFRDRRDAGAQLALVLASYAEEPVTVLALPRGGVPVAHAIAEALGAPLDLVLVRKIGAPGFAELGIGAVVDGHAPQLVLNEDLVQQLQVPQHWIDRQVHNELLEIERRRARYCGDAPAAPLTQRIVIVVDDGIATGGTVRAALKAIARARPSSIVLAVPVAPATTLDTLRPLADDLVCLDSPEPFYAVGNHYEDFRQTSDEEVVELLEQRRAQMSAPGPLSPRGDRPSRR